MGENYISRSGNNAQPFNINVEPPEIKNPQLVKIYGDLQKKSILVGFWLNFCVITIIIYLLTLASNLSLYFYRKFSLFLYFRFYIVPSAAFSQTSTIYGCPTTVYQYYPEICSQETSISQDESYWIGVIKDISPLNQMLLLEVTFNKNNSLLFNKQLSVKVNVSIGMLISQDNNDNYMPVSNNSNSLQIDCLDTTTTDCSLKYLAYMSELDATNYFFVVDFSNNNPSIYTWAADYQMTFVTINPQYSQFLLALRYAFVAISFLANFLYIRRIYMIPHTDLVIEQKLIFVMGLLLILFNDPFAGLTVLYPNIASGFFSVFFTINFCVILLLFWIVMFQRIWQDNDKKETQSFNIWKLIFIGIIWIFLFIPYILLTVMKVSNPMVGFGDGIYDAYDVFKYVGLVIIGCYLGILLNYYIRICRVYDSRLWRHKTLFMFSNYFIFAMFIFIFMGGFNMQSKNGQGIFLEISILNLYIYFLQFLYSPTSEGIKESFQFVSQEKALKYNAFDLLDDDKEEDLNINFEHNQQGEGLNEIEIHEEKNPNNNHNNRENNRKNNGNSPLKVIDFQEESLEKIEDLNISKEPKNSKSDVFI